MIRYFFILTLFFLLHTTARSQSTTNSTSYTTGLGVKVWDGAGISLKHFFNPNHAGEFIAYFPGYGGFRLTGLYEIHGDISGAPGLKWYIGPGAHLGFYRKGYVRRGHYYSENGTVAGIDGVLGLDYKFRGAPINLSLDWQPTFEFGNYYNGFWGNWGGLGIRYTF